MMVIKRNTLKDIIGMYLGVSPVVLGLVLVVFLLGQAPENIRPYCFLGFIALLPLIVLFVMIPYFNFLYDWLERVIPMEDEA